MISILRRISPFVNHGVVALSTVEKLPALFRLLSRKDAEEFTGNVMILNDLHRGGGRYSHPIAYIKFHYGEYLDYKELVREDKRFAYFLGAEGYIHILHLFDVWVLNYTRGIREPVIKIRTTSSRAELIVEFSYNASIVKAIRTVPTATFLTLKDRKVWLISMKYRSDLLAALSKYTIEIDGMASTPEVLKGGGIPEDRIPSRPLAPGYEATFDGDGLPISSSGFKAPPLAEFQVKGFNVVYKTVRGFILADEMGLGKTWQVLNGVDARIKNGRSNRIIVLAKSSILYNWLSEIKAFTDLEGCLYNQSTPAKRFKLATDIINGKNVPDILVMSYDTFRNDVETIKEIMKTQGFDTMVMDEAHKIANPTSKIGTLLPEIKAKCFIMMTGTPIINNPLECFNYFKILKLIPDNINWYKFRNYYGILDKFKRTVGVKHVDELRPLFATHMLRRLKKTHLKSLPDEIYEDVLIEMPPDQAKIYKAVLDEVKQELILGKFNIETMEEPGVKLLRLQQAVNHPAILGFEYPKPGGKIARMAEIIEEVVEAGTKAIIFTSSTEFLKIIQNYLQTYPIKGARYVMVTGADSSKRRSEKEAVFKTDPDTNLFFGSTKAVQEGMNLQVATEVIFLDLPWTWAAFDQAFSRAHRAGQKSHVRIRTFKTLLKSGDKMSHTIDNIVQQVIAAKKGMSDDMLNVTSSNNSNQREMMKQLFKGA